MANYGECELKKCIQIVFISFQIFGFIKLGLCHPVMDSAISVPRVQMLNVDSATDKTLCPFDVTVDRNENRWPVEVTQITCRKDSSHHCKDNRCQCTQLIQDIVMHPKDGKSGSWTMNNYIGCVCLLQKDSSPDTPPQPDIN